MEKIFNFIPEKTNHELSWNLMLNRDIWKLESWWKLLFFLRKNHVVTLIWLNFMILGLNFTLLSLKNRATFFTVLIKIFIHHRYAIKRLLLL